MAQGLAWTHNAWSRGLLLYPWLGVIREATSFKHTGWQDGAEQSIWLEPGKIELLLNKEHPELICFLKCHCTEKLHQHSQPGMPGLEIALGFWTACKLHKSMLSQVIRCLHGVCTILSQESRALIDFVSSPGFPSTLQGICFARERGVLSASPLWVSEISSLSCLLLSAYYMWGALQILFLIFSTILSNRHYYPNFIDDGTETHCNPITGPEA